MAKKSTTKTTTVTTEDNAVEKETVVTPEENPTDNSNAFKPLFSEEEPEITPEPLPEATPVVSEEPPVAVPESKASPVIEDPAKDTSAELVERLEAVIETEPELEPEEPPAELTYTAEEIEAMRASAVVNYHKAQVRHWSESELITWYQSGTVPVKTKRNNYINSPAMEKESIENLSLDYFKDYYDGELVKFPGDYTDDEIVEQVRIRLNASVSWSDREVIDNLLYGVIPVKTTDGVYVTDRMRDLKSARFWSINDLLAYAKGEVTSTAVATDETLVAEIRRRLKRPSYIPRESILMELIQAQEERPSRGAAILAQLLPRYADTMLGKILTDKNGIAFLQTEFFHAIKVIIGEDAMVFHNNWTTLLDFVNDHRKTIFSMKTRYRGLADMGLSPTANKNFQNILELLVATADPATRNSIEADKIVHFLRFVATDDIRNKILGYYNG